jgi:Tol biopolymer transport system component
MAVRRLRALFAVLLVFAACAVPQNAEAIQAQPIQRISSGTQGQGGGSYAAISGNGQLVVFESPANDLASQHISGSWDVYAGVVPAQKVELVSLAASGKAVDNPGDYTSPPAVSRDGRFVAFVSQAADLVSGDTNGAPDVFLRDRVSGATRLVSLNRSGGPANGPSFTPAISGDGRYVVFQSFASNLVSGDTNAAVDVFLRDTQTNTTELISLTNNGAQGSDPHDYGYSSLGVSDDGRYVVFSYQDLPVSGNLIGQSAVYLRDRQAKTTRLIATGEYPVISANGRFVVFSTPEGLLAEDQNYTNDVYLFDQVAKTFERISLPAQGLPEPNAWILSAPDVSADGRFVAYETTGAMLSQDSNDTSDIYLRDRQQKETLLLSSTPSGAPGSGESHNPAIDDAGRTVAFNSLASDLVSDDNNQRNDVFIRSLGTSQFIPSTFIYLPMMVIR